MFMVKALVSGLLVAGASAATTTSPRLGALLIGLPLISILTMVWVKIDGQDIERIAALSESTFWIVLPSLPMFLILPWLLRMGFPFWGALTAGCGTTVLLYLALRPFISAMP